MSQPLENELFDVGTRVPIAATLTLQGGGAWPVSGLVIPVSASWSDGGSIVNGTTSTLFGQAVAGPGVVTAGWDGGLAVSRNVGFLSCDGLTGRLQPYEVCTPTVDGGRATPGQIQVSWVAPADDSLQRGPVNASFSALVQLVVDGGFVAPPQLPVTDPDGGVVMLMRQGATTQYAGPVPMRGPEGPHVFVAGWPGSPVMAHKAARTVTWDETPPSVTVVPQARPTALGDADPLAMASWKKDETALVAVTVTGATQTAQTNDLRGVGYGAVTGPGGMSCGSTCTMTPGCRCITLNLRNTPMNALRGTVPVRVLAGAFVDAVGNPSPQVDANVNVTRVKWTRDISLASSSTPMRGLAVSTTGRVVAAVEERGGMAGRVVAYDFDGGFAWEAVTAGTVTAGPVVGATEAVVGTLSGVTSQLQPLALSGGTPGVGQCNLGILPGFVGDLALATVGSVEVPLGVRNGEVQGQAMSNCRAHLLTPLPTDVSARPSLTVQTSAANAVEAFVAYDGDAVLWKQTLTNVSWAAAGAVSLPLGTQPRGLFFDGAGRAGGGGVVGNGALFTIVSGELDAGTMRSFPAANAGAPVLGVGAAYYGTSGGTLVRAPYATGSFSDGGVVAAGVGNLQAAVPVVGQGGLLYAVGASGSLTVRNQSDLSELWSGNLAPLTGSGNVSQLALDVYRVGAGAKECTYNSGVLYVMTRASSTATVRAIVVDSKGLDVNAPWPKYQRDNGNTGNINSDLTPWACP